MDKKSFILAVIIILLATTAAQADYATWISRAFKIGDGKDIDLNGASIGNGSLNTTSSGIINTKNYASIQAAIDAANASVHEIYIPCGVYIQKFNITKRITVSGCGGSNGTLGVSNHLTGQNGTVIQAPNNDNVINITMNSSVEGIAIKNLAIYGAKASWVDPATDQAGNGIFINGSGTGWIENVWVEGMIRNGINFNNTAQGWWVSNSYFVKNAKTGVIIANQSHSNMLTNVHSEGNAVNYELRGNVRQNKFVGSWSMWASGDGLQLTGMDGSGPKYNQFVGFESTLNGGSGVNINMANDTIFTNILTYQNGNYGVAITNGQNNTFTGGVISDNSYANPGSFYNIILGGTNPNNNSFYNIISINETSTPAASVLVGGGADNVFAGGMIPGNGSFIDQATRTIVENVHGVRGYSWGTFVRTGAVQNLSANGAGDTFINLSIGKNDMCISTAAGQNSWVFAGNRSGSC